MFQSTIASYKCANQSNDTDCDTQPNETTIVVCRCELWTSCARVQCKLSPGMVIWCRRKWRNDSKPYATICIAFDFLEFHPRPHFSQNYKSIEANNIERMRMRKNERNKWNWNGNNKNGNCSQMMMNDNLQLERRQWSVGGAHDEVCRFALVDRFLDEARNTFPPQCNAI